MKTIMLIALLAAMALLQGCNKDIEIAKQRGQTDRYNAQLANELRIEKLRLENLRIIAEGTARTELAKQAKFYAFIGPFGQFVIVVVTAGGLVWGFRYLKFAADQNSANRQHDLDKFREAEITAREKFKLTCDYVMKPEFFNALSDENKRLVLDRLPKPPEDPPPETPRTPLHERMYDDLKGWASRGKAV